MCTCDLMFCWSGKNSTQMQILTRQNCTSRRYATFRNHKLLLLNWDSYYFYTLSTVFFSCCAWPRRIFEMNEFFYLQTPFVTRKIRSKEFSGRRHTFDKESQRTRKDSRRVSDSSLGTYYCNTPTLHSCACFIFNSLDRVIKLSLMTRGGTCWKWSLHSLRYANI